MQHIEIR